MDHSEKQVDGDIDEYVEEKNLTNLSTRLKLYKEALKQLKKHLDMFDLSSKEYKLARTRVDSLYERLTEDDKKKARWLAIEME